jgi:Fe-S cluster assembly iron-binding protein IscA
LGLTLDELQENDEQTTSNGIQIVYKKSEIDYLNNSVIDFEESPWGRGFTVRSALSGSC